jgi:LuxR family maltose regulon positive regulatory protein
MQQDPLLQTKLCIPPIRPELVSRPRLTERLDESLNRKLTLVSAPAGFGKTTLLSAWVASVSELGGREQSEPRVPVAWLSLDGEDSDPVRFLT